VKAVAFAVALLIGLAACGESDEEAGPAPSSASGGGSINVTFSGAINGSSTKLVKTDCKAAAHQTAGHLYLMSLYTVVNGKQYELSLVINGFTGPVTLTLPHSGSPVELFQVVEENGRRFESDARTTGTITQAHDLMSGSYDLHRLSSIGGGPTLDVKASYKCT
jgi:hypothetical protein